MSPITPTDDTFVEALETCRQFLLAIANAELSSDLRPKGGASDLVQESLVAAYQSRHQFRGETLADLRAWLRAILLNELGMFRRRFRSTDARDISREVALGSQLIPSHSTPVEEIILQEREDSLAAAVARLPLDFRRVVLLHLDDGLTFAVIGEQIGRTEEATRKLFGRALILLREKFPATCE